MKTLSWRNYRLQIAVDDVLPAQKPEALDQRVGEAADQVETEALVVVLLDQLVQVETAICKVQKSVFNSTSHGHTTRRFHCARGN